MKTNLLTRRTSARSLGGAGRRRMRQLSLLRGVACAKQVVLPCNSVITVTMDMDDPMLEDLQVIETIEAYADGSKVKATMRVCRKGTQLSGIGELDELATHESINAGVSRYSERTPELGCGPLRAFLNQRLGKPIHRVEADLHKRCGNDFFFRSQLRQTFKFLVKTNVSIGEDGRIYNLSCSVDSVNYVLKSGFYVHPELGTLEKVTRKPKSQSKPSYEQVDVDDEHKLVKVDGLWFMVGFKPLPTKPEREPSLKPADTLQSGSALSGRAAAGSDLACDYEPLPPLDVVTGERAYGYASLQAFGAEVYAVSKRAACSDEIRKYVIGG